MTRFVLGCAEPGTLMILEARENQTKSLSADVIESEEPRLRLVPGSRMLSKEQRNPGPL